MSIKEQEYNYELEAYQAGLKKALREWLASQRPPRTQTWLARKLSVSSQDVSSNLNPTRPITEGFIQKVSFYIPDWSHVYIKYLELKSGSIPSMEMQAAADRKKSKAKKIASLRAAEEEVIKGIRALTAAAIEVLDQND